MKLNFTSRKRLARIASFLFTLLFVAGAAFSSYAQQPMERVYADDVEKSNDDHLLVVVKAGYVENENNAVDGDPNTAATLNSTGVNVGGIVLGGEAVIRLRFTGANRPSPGTPVTVKMGLGGAVLSLLNNITVQPINGAQTNSNGGGNEVGTAVAISDIVDLLAGEDQIEFTVTPNVAYDGLKIRLSPAGGVLGLGVLAKAEVYEAYFLQPASGPLACDQPVDVLYGATGSVGSILNPVENPYNAFDNNPSTYAELRATVSAVDNRTHITGIFPGSTTAGDSIRIIVQDPGGLLDLALISEKFYVKTFNGTTDNGYLELNQNLLRLNLLAGESDIYEITYPVDQPFDRIQVAVGGGLAAALERLRVYEISRLAVGPQVDGLVDDILATCEGGTTTLTIESPEAGLTYQWYDESGTAVGTGTSFDAGVLAAGDHIYYVSSTRSGCTTESGRTMAIVRVNPTSLATDITLDDVATCEGTAAVLSPTSTVSNPVYTWYKDINKTEAITDGLTEGPVSYGVDASGVLTVTGLAAGTNATYYVAVSGDGQCENAAGELKPVNVTVTAPPDAPVAPPMVSANTGDNVTLVAELPTGAPAGATIVWYDSSNTEIGTGTSIQVGPFATAGSYTFHAAVRVEGCESAFADVVVEVTGAPVLPDETCNLPTSQANGTDGLLCLACQIINPNNSIDDNPDNFTRLTMGAGLAASVYQQLIFDQADKAANDSIRVRVAFPGGLADLGVLFQSTELIVRNGTAEVSRYDLEDGLITLRLLGGNSYEVTVPAGGDYDRLEVRLNGGLLSAVTSLDIYGAQIIYPGPQDIPEEGITVCAGETPTLTVTGEANTTITWFASATGGAALGTGNSYTPAAPLTASTTYYIEVSREGVNCVNPERIPFTVTVAPGATAADIVAGNTTICEASTAVLTASLAPGVTLTNPVYRWYSDAGLTDLVHEEAASESSFTTPVLTANTTYYVTVQGVELCENDPADAKAVTVTVGEAPDVPEVQADVTISAGQSTTLTASFAGPAPADVELVWYDAATLGNELGTGESYTTGPLTATTTFYVAARNTVTGCESLTRAAVTVNVEGTVPGECLVANAQTTSTYFLCLLCSVENPGAAVDGDPNTASRFIVPAAVTGGASQDLIFAETGQAGDTIVVLMGLSGSLLDADLLGGVTFESYNGDTGNGDGDKLGGGLLELKLLPGNTRGEIKFIAGGTFDRVRVTYRPTLGVLNSSLELFEARIQLPDPTALPPDNQTVCQGGTLSLTATAAAGTTLQWYDAATGGNLLATGDTYDFVTDGTTPAGTHTFYLAVTRDGCANPERIPVSVTVTEAFTADAIVAADVTICPGTATVTLNAELAPGITITDPVFTWYSDEALTTEIGTGATLTLDPAPVAATTTYYVTVSEAGGACENLAGNAQDVVVTVTDAPAAPVLVEANITACEGSVATFEIDSPQGGVVYNWYDAPTGGTLIHTGTSFTIDPATTDITYYIETAVDGGGCVSDTRTEASLTVTPSATAADLTGPDAEVLCEGESIVLTVSTTAVNPVIRWYSDAALTDLVHEEAAAESNYTTPVLSQNTTYYVTVEGDGLCENQPGDAKVITVTVSEAPAAPEVQANVTISSGQSATLTASLAAGTSPDVEIVWYSAATGGTELGTGTTFNTGPLTASTTYYVGTRHPVSGCESLTRVPVTVTVEDVTPGECLVANAQTTSTYFLCLLCSVENPGAAVDGDPNTASRFVVPAAVTGGASQDLIFAETGQAGDTIVVLMGLSGSLLDADLLGGVTFESYNGDTGNGDGDKLGGGLLELKLLPGNTRGEIKFIAGGTFDRVRVTYRPTLGVLNSSLELFEARIQLPDPTALPPDNQTVCQGGTLSLTATAAAGTTLQWYDAATGGNLLATGDTYDFVTDGTTPAGTHTFYLAVTRDGCANPERIPVSVTVTEAFTADAIVAADVTICPGTATVTLNAELAPGITITDPVFTWYSDEALTTEIGTGATLTLDPAPVAATTTYYVTVSEAGGACENLAGNAQDVVVTVTDAPAAPVLVEANITACEGSVATFEIDSPQGGVVYNWYDAPTGGTLIHTGTSFTIDPATTDITYYIETAVDGGGCVSDTRTEASLTVTPSATAADLTGPDAEVLCEGESIVLTVSTTAVNPVIRWYSDAALTDLVHEEAAAESNYTTPVLSQNTTYYVTVEGDGLCENQPGDAKVITVTVSEAPAAPEVQANVTISSGQSATLTASLAAGTSPDVEIVWYSAATGGTELGTGTTFNTGPLTASTTYYVGTRHPVSGCESLTRVPVTVTVEDVTPGECLVANAQTTSTYFLCLLCSVENPGAAVDGDPNTASRFVVPAAVTGGASQDLIFAETGQAGDTIVVLMGLSGSLLDADLLGGVTFESYNGDTGNGDGDKLGGGLLELKLLPGNTRGEIKFIAGGTFDRVRVTYRPTLGVLNSSLELFEARIQLPDPTALPPDNQTVCQGGTLSLTATAAAGTTLQWYDAATGGNLLATGDTYDFVTDGTTPAGTHTFYLAVTRDGCANPERIPVSVTVTEAYDADDIVAPGVTICEGTTIATLTAEAAPGLAIVNPVFTWYSDEALTTEIGTGATLTLDPAPTATTTYYVTISESDGSCENLSGSAKAVVVTVTDAPAAPTLVEADITACEGSVVTFEIDNAQGGVTYNWYDAATGGNLVHTGASLSVDPATTDMTWYIEAVVDGGGCTSLARAEATLTVTPTATAADITAADLDICQGETAMLSASSSTITAPVFRWYSSADLSDVPHEGATYDVSGLGAGTHTFYVTVEGTGVCANLPADAKVVTVTVGEAPAVPQVQANVEISSGQSATLVASLGDPAAADVELVWYDAPTGGNELGTGATYTTGPLTATTTYYVAARNTVTGCESMTRAEVTVVVDGVNPPQDCITANAQTVGAEGLCLICSVANPGYAVDADPDTYSQLNASVGIAAGVWQELIFPEAGAEGDRITLELGLNSALADIAVLGGLTVESYNGTTANGDGGAVDTDLIELIILPGSGNRFTVSFTAGATFDRVRVRFAALVAALENVRIYGAQMHFAPPTALPPADLTVCRGESVTLEATPAPGTSIRWYDAETGGNLLSDQNSFTTEPLMTVGQVTYYIAVVRNGCEDPERIAVNVTVTASPTAADIAVTGNENPICADEPVILTPSSSTITDPVFTWYKDAAKTQPITNGTEGGITYAIDAAGVLTVTGLTADATYWVSVTADGGNGCENPAGDLKSVPVSVQPNAPDGSITDVTVAGDNGNGEVCMPANGEVVLTATSSLSGAVFHWYDQDGNPVPGGENGVLTLTNLAPGTYTYLVGVSNPDFCETIAGERASITFTILPTVPGDDLAAIELTGQLPGGDVCVDGNGEVTLTAALTANSTVQNPVFHWYDGNGDPVAGGENGVQKLALAPGTYTFSVGASGDGFCETLEADRKSITFTVNRTAGPDDLADLTLNGNVPAGGVCLAPGEEVILTAALTANSTITDPVFHFYDEAGDPVTGGANGELNLGELAAGTYTFYAGVSGNGVCETLEADRKSITFTISKATTGADITAANATICEGESAVLTAETTTVTNPVFRWYSDAALTDLVFTGAQYTTPALTANTTYYVTVAGDGACEGEGKAVSVDVGRGATAADITASDAATCGEEVTLSASSSIENAVFNWYSDADLTQLVHTGDTYTLTPTDDVTYYVTVQGTGVCENAAGEAKEVHVTVGQEPEPPVITSTNEPVCPGEGVTLTAESQAGTEIVWYTEATGGDPIFTGPELVIDEVSSNTTYYAEARTAGGSCVSATRTAVDVEVIPQLAAPVVSCQDRTPSTVTFTWTEVQGATGYLVNVNDAGWEEPSSGPNGTTHLIENANPSLEYTIRVQAISGVNVCGNSESQATACEVEDFNDLFIPNAFTPNGDGKNDFFEVLGTYQSLDLKIYNQWGNKVFETRTKGQKWDGTYKGEILPTGVYVYFVTVKMNDGREVFKKGSISLIR